MNRLGRCGAAVAAAVLIAGQSTAAEPRCGSPMTRDLVVPCALRASYAVQAQRDELDATRGREKAESPLLPSNPTLSFSGARRTAAGQSATNWHVSLAQELEIAGQRGLRRDAARAGVAAQEERLAVARRDVAADALAAFYEVIAAREEALLSERLTSTTRAVSRVARAKADRGLIAPVDADVADAAAVRVVRAQLAGERRAGASLARLTVLTGGGAGSALLDVRGELEPLPGLEEVAKTAGTADPSNRPEVQALDAERRAMELRASAFRRSRVPNPTVSAFVENDGFSERVLGLGISLPVPIPGNVGRTFNGEVAESEARARRATSERERTKRELHLAMLVAAQALESRRREVAAYAPELLSNSETSLRALAQEVESGRITVREAVVAQQSLIELLQGYVAARRDLCLASVELARASGLPLDGGVR